MKVVDSLVNFGQAAPWLGVASTRAIAVQRLLEKRW